MKIAIAVLICTIACVSAGVTNREVGDKGILPKCNRNNVGSRHPVAFFRKSYWECVQLGKLFFPVVKHCEKGQHFSKRCGACLSKSFQTCPVDEVPEPETPIEEPVEEPEVPEEPEEEPEVPEEPVEEPEVPEEPVEEESSEDGTSGEGSSSSSSESNEDGSSSSSESNEDGSSSSSESNEDGDGEVEPTEAPVESGEVEPTDAPVESGEVEPTEAPVESGEVEPTDAPVESGEVEPTDAPVESGEVEPTDAPVESGEVEPTDAPVESGEVEPTDAPEVPEPTDAPEVPCEVKCTGPWDVPEYHVDPESCHNFYQCSNGVPHLHNCPSGLVYNPTANPGPVCDWSWNYECTGKPGCQTPEPEPEPCDVAPECILPWDQDEYYGNPADCGSFYQCSNGKAMLMPCPAGLHFDVSVRPGPVCNWPEDAKCKETCKNKNKGIFF